MILLTTQVNRGTFAIGARNSDNRRLPPRKTMRLFLRPEYIRGRNANVQGASPKALWTDRFRYFYPRMSGGLETSHFRQQPETEEQAMPELAPLSVSDLNTTVNHEPPHLLTSSRGAGIVAGGASNSTERTPPERRAFLSSTFDSYRLWRESGNKKPLRRKYPGLSLSGLKLPLPAGHSKPFLVANINANREGCNMTQLITIDDLNTTVNHEPRIRDLTIAERLGFEHPHRIKELIERNKEELDAYGEVSTAMVKTSSRGGRPGKSYYLNEGQCLVLCALSRTPQAAAVRKAIIEVFMAHRRGAAEAAPAITGRDPIVPIRMMQAVGVEYIADKMMTMDKSRDARLAVLERRLAAIEGWLGRAPRLNQAIGRAK